MNISPHFLSLNANHKELNFKFTKKGKMLPVYVRHSVICSQHTVKPPETSFFNQMLIDLVNVLLH